MLVEPFLFEIRVRPNASRSNVGGSTGNPLRLIVAVQAPAVDGKAIAAVRNELAKVFGLRARDFTIVLGEHGRDKRILVSCHSSEVRERYETLIAVGRGRFEK